MVLTSTPGFVTARLHTDGFQLVPTRYQSAEERPATGVDRVAEPGLDEAELIGHVRGARRDAREEVTGT